MYKVGFTQMGASFIVTLSQSRSGNSQMVRDAMASIFSTYAKIPESQGIFNRTFKGYTKTNYENNTIWTSRYIDLSLMPKVEATTISPDEAEGVSVGAIILLVVGLILLLAAVVYILFFSRSGLEFGSNISENKAELGTHREGQWVNLAGMGI
eukprot:maker-scaffold706_size108852-snap-gene-0.20 protein:Tk07361 transcript:maker-scaffold706_size108852-snap-gene-0.20-mRNA-1 annotation:"carcinoembryonic antigen-related cell adhesion molecule 8-like isoform x1"